MHGRITDAVNGAPISGAVVSTSDGRSVTSASDGAFALSVTPPTSLLVYAEGYVVGIVDVTRTDTSTEISLDPEDATATELIEVESQAPDLAEPTTYGLALDDVRALPGAGNDVLRAAQTLPGVARVPYGLGGLVLRGVSPGGTAVYLDDVEVPQAFHFAALTSFVPSTLLESFVLVPGGGDASLGRATGGAAILRTRAPRSDHWREGAELSMVDVAATAEGPVPGGAIAIGLRRSHLDVILGEIDLADDRLLPRYYDGQLRWDIDTSHGTLTALFFGSDDHLVALASQMTSRFTRAALRYERVHQGARFSLTPWLGHDLLRLRSDQGAYVGTFERSAWLGGARGSVLRDARWGHVAGGVDLRAERARFDYEDSRVAGGYGDALVQVDAGAWAEARWRHANGRLTVRPGLRVDMLGANHQATIDPRLAISHELSGTVTLRETIGIHHEAPPAALGDVDLRAPRGVHASVGLELRLPLGLLASTTGFAVFLDHLPVSVRDGDDPFLSGSPAGGLGAAAREVVDEQLGAFTSRESRGRGRSIGAELALQRRVGRWTGWLAYTVSRAERAYDPRRTLGITPYALDQTHNLSVVSTVALGRWRLGARLRVATGNPYTPLLGLDLDPRTAEWSYIYGDHNSLRLPTHASVDVRVDHTWHASWGSIEAFLDVQNASNADNVEDVAIERDVQRPIRGLPLFLGRSASRPRRRRRAGLQEHPDKSRCPSVSLMFRTSMAFIE